MAKVPAGYFYYNRKNFSVVSRHTMRKDVFEKTFSVTWDSSLSERENASKVNCFVVGDAGKNKWIFKSAINNIE